MVEQLGQWIAPLLQTSIMRQTRRNHGLEHATVHILSARIPHLSMAGRSDAGGFVLLGEAKTEQVTAAANEALRRMKRGEHDLAIHPNCGTNMVTTALLVSVAALIGVAGAQRAKLWDRLSVVFTLVIMALFFAPSLGLQLQKHITTDGELGDLEIVTIRRSTIQLPFAAQPLVVHRVTTRGG